MSVPVTSTLVAATATQAMFQEHGDVFLKHMESLRYKPSTVNTLKCCIEVLAKEMQKAKNSLINLDNDLAFAMLKQSPLKSYHGVKGTYLIKHFVRYLRDRGIAKPWPVDNSPRAVLQKEFSEYLKTQRGLTSSSIEGTWSCTRQFLEFRFPTGDLDLHQLSSLDIVQFLQYKIASRTPYRNKTLSTFLRRFFNFLFQHRRISSNLASAIPKYRQTFAPRLPRSLTPDQIETILQSVKMDTAIGRRNYAMVLLLARLGLRASEVIAIQIDDLDWRAGEITIRGKGLRRDRMPMPPDVGAAIAEYIRRDRDTDSRVLFVGSRAPRHPFSDAQVLNTILKKAFQKTKIQIPQPYVGSHILRHSLAVALVQRGATIHEIGEVLRHRCRQSTKIYARYDLEGLRSLALSWPTKTGGVSS